MHPHPAPPRAAGIVGSMPWVSLTWLTTWLQARGALLLLLLNTLPPLPGDSNQQPLYEAILLVPYPLPPQLLGFSDLNAASLMATFSFGCALGGLLGACSGRPC